MTTINDANDWWQLVDLNWSKIVDIFERCGAPLGDHWWSEGIGQEATHHDEVLPTMLVRLLSEPASQIARVTNAVGQQKAA